MISDIIKEKIDNYIAQVNNLIPNGRYWDLAILRKIVEQSDGECTLSELIDYVIKNTGNKENLLDKNVVQSKENLSE